MNILRAFGASHTRSPTSEPPRPGAFTPARTPLALCLAAASLLLAERLIPAPPPPAPPPPAPPIPPAPVPRAAPAAAHDPESFARTILARPLFTAGRHPPDRPAATAATTLPRLAGTVVASRSDRLAILVAADGHPFVVHEGADSHGLIVLAIEPRRIVAETAGGRVTIGLASDGRTGAATPMLVAAPVMTKDPRSRAPDNQDE